MNISEVSTSEDEHGLHTSTWEKYRKGNEWLNLGPNGQTHYSVQYISLHEFITPLLYLVVS